MKFDKKQRKLVPLGTEILDTAKLIDEYSKTGKVSPTKRQINNLENFDAMGHSYIVALQLMDHLDYDWSITQMDFYQNIYSK